MVVERLDAQPVAGDKELLAARVPDGEGEHAAEVLHAVVAVFLVEVDDGFGVAVGAVDDGRAASSCGRSSAWL